MLLLVCLLLCESLLLLLELHGQFLPVSIGLAEHFHASLIGQRLACLLGLRFGFLGGVSPLPAFGEKLVGLADPVSQARDLGGSLHGGEEPDLLADFAGLPDRSFCLFLELPQGLQPFIHSASQVGQLADSGGRSVLGLLGGLRQIVAVLPERSASGRQRGRPACVPTVRPCCTRRTPAVPPADPGGRPPWRSETPRTAPAVAAPTG